MVLDIAAGVHRVQLKTAKSFYEDVLQNSSIPRGNTPGLTETLVALTFYPKLFSFESVHMLEKIVVLVYSKGCGTARVNEARQRLFSTGSRTVKNKLSTQAVVLALQKRQSYRRTFTSHETSVRQEIPDFVNGVGTKTRVTLCYCTGHNSEMPVRHVPSSGTLGTRDFAGRIAKAVKRSALYKTLPRGNWLCA